MTAAWSKGADCKASVLAECFIIMLIPGKKIKGKSQGQLSSAKTENGVGHYGRPMPLTDLDMDIVTIRRTQTVEKHSVAKQPQYQRRSLNAQKMNIGLRSLNLKPACRWKREPLRDKHTELRNLNTKVLRLRVHLLASMHLWPRNCEAVRYGDSLQGSERTL